jgi:hypothetical protein
VKPSSKPVLCVAVLALAVTIVGSFVCYGTGGESFQTAQEQLKGILKDFNSAVDQGTGIGTSGTDILNRFDTLKQACPAIYAGVDALCNSCISQTITQLDASIMEVRKFTDDVAPLAKNLTDVVTNSDDVGVVAAVAFAVPMLLVTFSCFIILSAILATRGCGGSCMARCNDCCLMRLGSLFIALSILLAAIVAAVETGSGTVIGSYCQDTDSNTLAYAKWGLGGTSVEYEAASFYVTGVSSSGVNPLEQLLNEASAALSSAKGELGKIDNTTRALLKVQCDGWDVQPVYQDIDSADAYITVGKRLVSRDNVYPYYQNLFQNDTCDTVITGLGWLVIIQLVVGLLLLPAVSCMASAFFAKWEVWQESQSAGLLQA